jgi:asparagine synthase (glutamine-hydrolysing)
MCGILGVVGHELACETRRFASALASLRHRGPDDGATWQDEDALLGHRRLSIIDLSAAGRQPMIDPGSGAVLVYNGEVYNYLEIRAELEAAGEVFRTRTDSEVLLKAFLRWREAALDRLNGMFAFAVWLPHERTLFFARDRFGVKPFYYAVTSQGFCFASEPKAILAAADMTPTLSGETLARFVAHADYQSGEETFYEGIRILRPGHFGTWQAAGGRLDLRRWWDYPAEAPQPQPPERAYGEFEALFDDAVRLRLRSDVPVGLSLSGGLDSTAILAGYVQAGGTPPVCLTSVYGRSGEGEAAWARRACAPYGLEPVAALADPQEWLGTLERIVWHMDGPCDTPAVFPVYCLMREARARNVPVMLEGQGADELFGGYPPFAALDLVHQMAGLAQAPHRLGAAAAAARRYRATHGGQLASQVLRLLVPGPFAWWRRRLGGHAVLRPEIARAHAGGEPVPASPPPAALAGDPVGLRLWRNHSFDSLPRFLYYSDALGMAHSIESRMPFMDYRLVEWAFRQASAIKLKDGETKWPVRAYLRRHGQGAVADRTDKKGYPTPLSRWLRDENGALVRELLIGRDARVAAFCEPERIARLFEPSRVAGFLRDSLLFRLLTAELWMRRCLDPQGPRQEARPARPERPAVSLTAVG